MLLKKAVSLLKIKLKIKLKYKIQILMNVCLTHLLFSISSLKSDFLGRTEVPVATIKKELENKGPVTRRLLLHEVPTGEVWVRLDLQLFNGK